MNYKINLEQYAHRKFPRKGKCEKSCFKNGSHRVGIVPTSSLLDGGVSGDSAKEICLECGKVFEGPGWFIAKRQPNKLGVAI